MDLTGFMFGNINEQGELENDELLDKVKILSILTVRFTTNHHSELVRLPLSAWNNAGINGNRRGRCG